MTLSKAIQIASKAHHGQTDKAGDPYIMHPLRVMIALHAEGWAENVQIVGVLHDTLEDTNVTLDSLRRAKFHPEVLEALQAITRDAYEPYEEYIGRVGKNWIAKAVKIADLRDNLRAGVPESLAQRYGKALKVLA